MQNKSSGIGAELQKDQYKGVEMRELNFRIQKIYFTDPFVSPPRNFIIGHCKFCFILGKLFGGVFQILKYKPSVSVSKSIKLSISRTFANFFNFTKLAII